MQLSDNPKLEFLFSKAQKFHKHQKKRCINHKSNYIYFCKWLNLKLPQIIKRSFFHQKSHHPPLLLDFQKTGRLFEIIYRWLLHQKYGFSDDL